MFSFVNKDYSDYTINEEYISKLEQKFNIVFPKTLKEYYLLHNNAETNIFKYRYLEIVEILPIFYGPNSVESIIFKNKNKGIISQNYIPFAIDKYERIIYWNNDDKNVYIFRHKNSNIPTLISNSVDSILR